MKSATTVRDSRILSAVAALTFVAALALGSCEKSVGDTAATSTSYSTHEAASSEAQLFTLPADQRGHVQVVAVEPARLERTLRLTGTVTYNSFETTPVITQVSGPVSRVMAVPGQVVRAGQVLLDISSPDFAQLRSNYLKSREASWLADKNYARAQDLYNHNAIAEADLLQAQSTRNQAQADLVSAEQALKVLGIAQPERMAENSASPEIPVLAPLAGQVVERLVAPGQVVQAGSTQVFTISNMSTVWVLANVYERDLAYVHVGDPVTVASEAYPTTFHGRISYIAPALDPTTRTLQVRIVTGNPGGKLKKDMYVTVEVRAGVIENALTVPDSAVLRNSENQPFVYAAQGPNQFAQRLVTIGESHAGKTQILSGLAFGERVVADGSLFLQFANSLQR